MGDLYDDKKCRGLLVLEPNLLNIGMRHLDEAKRIVKIHIADPK